MGTELKSFNSLKILHLKLDIQSDTYPNFTNLANLEICKFYLGYDQQ